MKSEKKKWYVYDTETGEIIGSFFVRSEARKFKTRLLGISKAWQDSLLVLQLTELGRYFGQVQVDR